MPGHDSRQIYALLPVLSALAFLNPQAVTAVIAALTLLELIARRS